ncbi:hypothetical protein PF010_g14783 [Phytophthora fragariae]|uniref:BZIP domain-containing protein n=1 Tax=Phytophthora fragariae TaxID=53985 RepID=A0A6A3JYC0_9STRA|nr:hypothetical protein PF011_g14442 [Phytophthora fragariae]KAE9100537.1 hypothetical protein PF010_g14783 [Phytophthora fragariae]KAE9212496.1 hypothetical protein PF004_g15613 [Phytophthora fragariae]
MTSMSLEFILNKPEEASGPRPGKQRKRKTTSACPRAPATTENCERSTTRPAHDKTKNPPASDRQQRVRQLQNLRQRRYRERKKSSASTQQEHAERLKQENAELEATILQHIKSRMNDALKGTCHQPSA